ncbi:MAG TPA: class I SAM-dependent methyltransferase [Sphingomonas sp.]|nr:class I SAM-dependent methyltransferase [Sphingomonas sp.]
MSDRDDTSARSQWDAAADGWNEQAPQIRAWLRDATATMLDMADIGPGMKVLDVAAGTGDQSCDIACRVGPGGSVLATDVSPRMLALAAANLSDAGLGNAYTLLTGGETHGLDNANFDAAVCRLGLMFFGDPLTGLQAIHRTLRPGGRFCAMIFAGPSANPCIGITVSIALRHAGLPASDPYVPGALLSLGKPGLIEGLFNSAGFVDVEMRSVSAPFTLASVEDYLRFVRTAAGPVMTILDGMSPDTWQAVQAEMAAALSAYATTDGWEAPTELLLVAGAR